VRIHLFGAAAAAFVLAAAGSTDAKRQARPATIAPAPPSSLHGRPQRFTRTLAGAASVQYQQKWRFGKTPIQALVQAAWRDAWGGTTRPLPRRGPYTPCTPTQRGCIQLRWRESDAGRPLHHPPTPSPLQGSPIAQGSTLASLSLPLPHRHRDSSPRGTPACRRLRESRRVRGPGNRRVPGPRITAHSGENGPAEWTATIRFRPAQRQGLSPVRWATAHSRPARAGHENEAPRGTCPGRPRGDRRARRRRLFVSLKFSRTRISNAEALVDARATIFRRTGLHVGLADLRNLDNAETRELISLTEQVAANRTSLSQKERRRRAALIEGAIEAPGHFLRQREQADMRRPSRT
jgi:hypothetical protein